MGMTTTSTITKTPGTVMVGKGKVVHALRVGTDMTKAVISYQDVRCGAGNSNKGGVFRISKSIHFADFAVTCKRCIAILASDAAWAGNATVAPVADAPCVCGKQAGERFHKRFCPAQEAAGISDTAALRADKPTLATPFEVELATCTRCTRSLTLVNGEWIGLNGEARCANGIDSHVAGAQPEVTPDASIASRATARICAKYSVDLHDWLVSPELPDHAHAVAARQIAVLQLGVIDAEGWGHPYVKAYSIALDVVMEHFLPNA